jgi:hypothetical protein
MLSIKIDDSVICSTEIVFGLPFPSDKADNTSKVTGRISRPLEVA